MKRFLLSIYALALPFAAVQAQELKAEFSEMDHDLGTLVWHNPAAAKFDITNTGTTDMVITDVEPDCGCTLVTWSEEPIPPGKAGHITVRYDAEQLGHFSKGVAVYIDKEQTPVYVTVSGNVVNETTPSDLRYDHHFGTVDLNVDEVEYDDVERGDEPFRTIEIRNSGSTTVIPTLMHLPTWLTASYAPDVLYPGRNGKILLTLNSTALPSMGLTQASVYLGTTPGERLNPTHEISVSVTLLPERAANYNAAGPAPVCRLDKTSIDATALASKERVKGVIMIENTGTAPLELEQLQVYNPGINVSVGSRTIKPGQKTKMKISVTRNVLRLKGRPRILLITNDPATPKVVVNVDVKK